MRGKRRKDKELWSGKWLNIRMVQIHPDGDWTMFVEDRHFNLRHFDEIKMHPSDVRMMTSLAQDAVRKYETEEEKA
jgi:hypothetical protein